MVLILLFFGAVLLLRDKKGKENTFFNLDTSSAMRGFWALVVVLVHIPADYQNPLQDAIGSFAYIGVTFFFMTSSYGLTLSALKNPQGFLKGFWRKRLFKLLIPMLVVNILTILAELIATKSLDVWHLLHINGWVKDLLVFYLAMWAAHKFLPKTLSVKAKSFVVIGFVMLFSLGVYFTGGLLFFGWPTELYGCIFGLLMALYQKEFQAFAQKKFWLKAGLGLALCVLLGLGYLKGKAIFFAGDYLLKILLGAAILGLIFVVNTGFSLGNPISRFLGSISYEIYLSHSVLFILLEALPVRLPSGLYILCVLGLTVPLSFGIHWFSGLFAPKKKSIQA